VFLAAILSLGGDLGPPKNGRIEGKTVVSEELVYDPSYEYRYRAKLSKMRVETFPTAYVINQTMISK
jgi:hypothetical protein